MRFFRLFSMGLFLALAPLAHGQTLEVLHYFNDGEGANPEAGLIQASDGNFYGTTFSGGLGNNYGTIFRMTPDGTVTTLISHFDDITDGFIYPGLLQASDGYLYGSTTSLGTVFKMSTNGVLQTLLMNVGSTALIEGKNGYIYGASFSDPGYIFRTTTNGAMTILASFNGTNGAIPWSLVEANDGDFYGTTYQGGTSNLGTVFKMTTNGTLTTLVSFCGTNGAYPKAPLLQANDGNFYGTTYSGGANDRGTVFRITDSGVLTTLVSFTSTNGGPTAGLIQSSDGYLYGTTEGQFHTFNLEGWGTVFQLSINGTLTTLFSFDGTNGATPRALIEGNDGNLYGTTRHGSIEGDMFNGAGTIFRIVMPVNLNSRVSGNELVLSWPTNAVGFTLQSSADLNSSTNWIDSTNGPVVVGAQFTVTNSISASAQFYRLRKP